jgi:hypothetical protein
VRSSLCYPHKWETECGSEPASAADAVSAGTIRRAVPGTSYLTLTSMYSIYTTNTGTIFFFSTSPPRTFQVLVVS